MFLVLCSLIFNDIKKGEYQEPDFVLKQKHAFQSLGMIKTYLSHFYLSPLDVFIKVIDVFFYPLNIRFFCSVAVMT